jgi:hypothetical protein
MKPRALEEWRGAAREPVSPHGRAARAKGESSQRKPQLSRHGMVTPSITNGEAAAGARLWPDIDLPGLASRDRRREMRSGAIRAERSE